MESMMTRSRPRMLAALAGVLLAGCGGGSTPAASAPPAPTSSPSSLPSPSGPSISQIASAVSQSQAGIEKLKEDLATNCDDYPLACGLTVQRAPAEAQLLMRQLGLFRPYPAELQSLVTQTVKDAQTLADADVRACAKAADSVDCSVSAVTIAGDVNNLLETLAGWEPYQ